MRLYTAERADLAALAALVVAERVAGLLDRVPGDSGDNPDVIEAIGNKLAAIERDLYEMLGEPKPVMERAHG